MHEPESEQTVEDLAAALAEFNSQWDMARGAAQTARTGANPAMADIPVLMRRIVDVRRMGFALGAAAYFTKPPVMVITVNDLTEEERRRLNGGVERIIQKGATSQPEALELARSITQRHLMGNTQSNT